MASELVCAQKMTFFTDYISFKKLSLAGEKVNSIITLAHKRRKENRFFEGKRFSRGVSPRVDFTNVFRARFSSANQNVTTIKTFLWKTPKKTRAKNVGEIDTSSSFFSHQPSLFLTTTHCPIMTFLSPPPPVKIPCIKDLRSMSATFYAKILRTQIPKAQKTDNLTVLLESACVKA